MIESELIAPCPSLEFNVVNFDFTPIDSAVYTSLNSGSTDFDLTIDTGLISKINTYNLLLRVKYTGVTYTYNEDVAFVVIIDDPCQTATLFWNSVNPTTQLISAY